MVENLHIAAGEGIDQAVLDVGDESHTGREAAAVLDCNSAAGEDKVDAVHMAAEDNLVMEARHTELVEGGPDHEGDSTPEVEVQAEERRNRAAADTENGLEGEDTRTAVEVSCSAVDTADDTFYCFRWRIGLIQCILL